MPGPLIDTAPFRRERDENLDRLVATLRAALDPDAVDLEALFVPHGRPYRKRLHGARAARRPAAAQDLVLVIPFREDGLVEGSLILHRGTRRPWTGAERMRFELLSPLAAQVLASAARSEVDRGARRRLLAAAERAQAPILVIDRAGTILYANEAADALLSTQTEEALAVLVDERRPLPLLSHLLRLAWVDPPVAKERIALTNGRFLDARVTTVDGAEGEVEERDVRVVTLSERAALTIDDVRPHLKARGVSGREAEVVAGVLQGMRNAEIAAGLYISEYTVKDHLKHIFHKLGVDSRGGLLRALYSVPAV